MTGPRSRRRIAAALGLLAVAAVAFLVLRAPPAGDADDTDRASREPVPDTSPALRDAPPVEAPRLEGASGTATPPLRDETAPAPPPPKRVTLALETVDAETGGPVTVRLDRDGLPQELGAQWDDLPYSVGDDERCVLRARLLPPSGHVLWEECVWEETRVSPYATSLRAVHPLRREAGVTASFVDGAGEPLRETPALSVRVAGRSGLLPIPRSDVAGRIRVQGVPFFRGETFEMSGRILVPTPEGGGSTLSGSLTASLPTRASDSVHVVVPLELELVELGDVIGIGGGAGAFRGRKRATAEGTSRIALDVVRRDGRPARGAQVRIVGRDLDADGERRTRVLVTERADESGRLTLERLPAGEYSAELAEVGLVPSTVTFAVEEGRAALASLREASGGEIHAVVVDEQGDPLPFARVWVGQTGSAPWADLGADGVQRIDRWTDHLGRRRFDHVRAGEATVSATWASRRGAANVEVVEGGEVEVRVVVR